MSSDNCELKNKYLYVQPIEVCSFASLYKLKNNNIDIFKVQKNKIFSSSIIKDYPDINYNFRNEDNTFIYKYNSNNNRDLCFPIKENDINTPYAINCVIATGNPLYTYNKEKKSCTIIPNLQFSNNKLQYSENNDYIYLNNNDPDGNYTYDFRVSKAFCENKWYDWIIIPNYHFGNGYYKDSGDYSPEDIRKCYKPCDKNKIPYIDINGKHKCISKKIADNGVYSKKLDYSPISFINMLGNNKQNLVLLYLLINIYEYDKIKKTDEYELIEERTLTNKNCSVNFKTSTIETDTKKCSNKSYNNLKEVIDFHDNILSDTIFKNIININNFESIKNYENYQDIITYNNIYFNEIDKELITLRGLINYNILSLPILIHTFIISYNIYLFITDTISDLNTFTPASGSSEKVYNKIETLKNNKYNVKTILKKIIENNNYYKNATESIKEQYLQRLANILYKSINICYDNKTEFSKNIIIKTKEAIDNLITSEYLLSNYIDFKLSTDFYFTSVNDNDYYKKNDSIINQKKTEEITQLRKYLDILNTGFEIDYIKSTNHNKENSFKPNQDITKNITEEKDRTLITTFKRSDCIYFNKEILEETSKCKDKEIYNYNTNNCEKCDEYCGKNNNCKIEQRCNYYCKNTCENKDNNEDQNFLGKTACGYIKKKINNTLTSEEASLKKNEYEETPLGENKFDFFSNFTKSIRTAIGIVFFLIIIYIIYIIYEIFGESIAIFFNFVLYNIKLIYTIITNFKPSRKGFNWKQIDLTMAEYIRDNNIDRFNTLSTKIFTKS